MSNFNDFSSVQKALTTARAILVALPRKPNEDKVAAALALFLSIKKMGKNVFVVCQDEMTVGFSSLVGANQVSKKIGGENLVISFDYVEDSIEKVSYNIEGGKFNLVIQPKEGFSPLNTDKVDYSYSGSASDLIFTIGSASLDHLGEIYQENKELFEADKVVNLDNSQNNGQFGKINLVNVTASSCSELVTSLLSKLGLPVDADIASNLFYGLERATQNFSSPKIGPGTFEAAAFCLRAGARRTTKRTKPKRGRGKPFRPIAGPTPPISGLAKDVPEEIRPERTEKKPSQKPSPDWLEPKIYRGNTRI